ncbi:MAG: hypothetical protein JWL77_4481 [Chthonomonadaceae bacterium]|nr:hypothetical protein [Chthonomonadaceae bacterium]
MKIANIRLYRTLIVLMATLILGAPAMAATSVPTFYWQNQATGDLTYWELNGASIDNYGFIDTISDTNWKIVGVR